MAIIFVTEIDNVAYEVGLAERLRTRVEVAGRVVLDEAELSALSRTKTIHIVLIVIAIITTVAQRSFNALWWTVHLAYLIGGVAECFSPDAATKTYCEVTRTVAKWAFGYIIYQIITMLILTQGSSAENY